MNLKIKKPPLRTALLTACVLTLVALALMAWSLVDPRPVPIMVAMSTGQVLGTLSLALFGWVVISDIKRKGTPIIPPDEPPHSLRSIPVAASSGSLPPPPASSGSLPRSAE